MIIEEPSVPTGTCGACGETITEEQWDAAEAGLLGIQHGVCPGSDEQSALDAVVEWAAAKASLKAAARRPKSSRLSGETDAARGRLIEAERALKAIAERN